MNERQIKLVVGSLLHDIGKLVYRSGDGTNHSESGASYLQEKAGLEDKEILDCVCYHHGALLKNADVAENSLAYLTYFADNVASAADRRQKDNPEQGFDRGVPLESIFNILNSNHASLHYAQQVLNPDKGINFPTDCQTDLDETFYQGIMQQITDNLRGIRYEEDYLNSLLTVLEANTTYLPSSTSKREVADISLYDHMKMTAAVAQCIEQALEENGQENYRKVLFEESAASYDQKWFLLYSFDISGIQKFIYSIGTKGALRGLRARSFYLEFIMEHIVDELLTRANLSRANQIYMGGGHCYLLLPNTDKVKQLADAWIKEVNAWLLNRFDTALYVAAGFVECSAAEMSNQPEGCYSELFRELSRKVSDKKAHRYTAKDIIALNNRKERGERECRICRRMEPVDEEGRCEICSVLESTSTDILYQSFFAVLHSQKERALPLPGECCMVAASEEKLKELMQSSHYVRSYTKNKMYTGIHVTAKLWVGSYTAGKTFEEFAKDAEGIERIAVLRADVDNLGSAFVTGFEEKYKSLSRTATFSRQLSLFFKGYINYILEHGKSSFFSSSEKRNVSIVYSGGDDLFLVGSWNEVIDAFIDIRNELMQFTENTLTLSGGVGLYPSKYPINLMAAETAALESAAKDLPGKNAISLFESGSSYSWEEFITDVLSEKYKALEEFFSSSDERGMAFLYRLLDLLRGSREKIQYARYIYVLARLEPDESSEPEKITAYRSFSEKMIKWYQSPEDREKLTTAIYLFVYRNRKREGE